VQGFVSQFTSYITDNPFDEFRFISVHRERKTTMAYKLLDINPEFSSPCLSRTIKEVHLENLAHPSLEFSSKK
jgi:hypothetical protein